MKPGILIISHGSRDHAWILNVDEAVRSLSLQEELPVAVSFLELVEGRLIQDGIDRLERDGVTDILVIPLFVSSGSTHVDEIAYALGVKKAPAAEAMEGEKREPASDTGEGEKKAEGDKNELAAEKGEGDKRELVAVKAKGEPTDADAAGERVRTFALESEEENGLAPFRVQARIHYGHPVDDDPDIAVMLWDKLRQISQNPEQEVILLVGHGSAHDGFRQRWQAGIAALAERVQQLSGAAAADYALLNPDSLRSQVEAWGSRGYTVLVAPLFLSEGYFTKAVIPRRLAGLSYRYSGDTLLPHPLMASWIGKQAERMLKTLRAEAGEG